MADGLDIFAAQDRILDYLTAHLEAAGYEVHEADIADAVTREYVNGVNQTTCVIQFGSMLPLARDKSFCGPELDGYYSLVRVMTIGSTPSRARRGNAIVNQLAIGFRDVNVGSLNVEGGGGGLRPWRQSISPAGLRTPEYFPFCHQPCQPRFYRDPPCSGAVMPTYGLGPCCAGVSYPLPEIDASFYARIGWMTNHVYLKNTVSGVVEEYDRKTAERYLKLYPRILVEVPSKKNEVLSAPYTVEDNKRRLIEPVIDNTPTVFEFEATHPAEEAKPRKKKDN